MSRFASDNVLVVGATSEIGTAIAQTLVREGARVTLTGRNQDKLEQLQASLGPHASIAICDLSNDLFRANAVKDAARRAGRFNAMVYVAGYHKLMPLGPGYAASLAEHLLLNVQAPLDLIKTFAGRDTSDDSRQRSVTVISSIAHRVGEPALSAYSASKGALVSAVRSLAVELARKNLRINTVSPGWIAGESAERVSSKISAATHENISSLYPLGFGTPSDVAEAVSYISSSAAKWVTGIDLVLDGGRTCV